MKVNVMGLLRGAAMNMRNSDGARAYARWRWAIICAC